MTFHATQAGTAFSFPLSLVNENIILSPTASHFWELEGQWCKEHR